MRDGQATDLWPQGPDRRLWPARLLLGLWLLCPWPSGAAAGEIRHARAASAALGRDIPYTLYLPDGYGANDGRYPVLYLLHGHGGGERDWPEGGRLAATLDRLVAAGEVAPMLVVMPGMGNGWYVDNPDPNGPGALATALLADLVPAIDRTWRTWPKREARAIAGLSMGGWGAVRFAMLRPDLFVAAGSLSGALIDRSWVALPEWQGLLAEGFGAPVDAARLQAASPLALMQALRAAEPRPRLYLACGDDDGLGLEVATIRFYLALREAGIEAELRITDGDHDWALWARELEPLLRFVNEAFSDDAAGRP
jgi:enterochelin esterase family protein